MRQMQVAVFLLLLAACFSQAQEKKLVPLLGSTQDIAKSDFCKKYKCSAVYDKQLNVLTHYVLTVEGQDPDFFERLGRTIILPRYDAKKQFRYAEIRLQKDSKRNLGTSNAESELVADFLYFALGKKFPLIKDALNEKYSPEIEDCFSDVRFLPRENDNSGSRVMLTGYLILENGLKKVRYQASCTNLTSVTDKNLYLPSFSLKILGQ